VDIDSIIHTYCDLSLFKMAEGKEFSFLTDCLKSSLGDSL
jgi:hypothetical protein